MYKRKFDLVAKAFALYGRITVDKHLAACFREEKGKLVFSFFHAESGREVREK